MDVDYENYKEPYYYRQNRTNENETIDDEITIQPFEETLDGVKFHVDNLTGDTIDVWCDLPDWEMKLSPYYYLRFVRNSPSGTKHDTRKEDIDALIAMGADYIDIGKMGDTVAVGFP